MTKALVVKDEEEAVRKLLTDRPDLQFFYIISLNYLAGSIGYSAFHSLATDQQECQATIQRICAEQKAECEREIAELKQGEYRRYLVKS